MASVKLFSLAVRTLAKPIANTIKSQAAEHETFRNVCIGLAQRMHRTEARLRMGLLNTEPNNVKPLNDTRAVQNGATTLAESFLFLVAAGLVLGETYRSNRKEGKRRDDVRERLEGLEENVKSMRDLLENGGAWKESIDGIQQRNEDFERILSTVVNNGLRAGWLSLGHNDGLGDMLPLLDPSKQKPLRKPSEIIGGEETDLAPPSTSEITNDDGTEVPTSTLPTSA